MSTQVIHRFIAAQHQIKVPHVPDWKLRDLLWRRCGGAKFVGIQEDMTGPDGERALILFNPPGPGPTTTLAVPRVIFDFSIFLGCVLAQHKIEFNRQKTEMARLGVRI